MWQHAKSERDKAFYCDTLAIDQINETAQAVCSEIVNTVIATNNTMKDPEERKT